MALLHSLDNFWRGEDSVRAIATCCWRLPIFRNEHPRICATAYEARRWSWWHNRV